MSIRQQIYSIGHYNYGLKYSLYSFVSKKVMKQISVILYLIFIYSLSLMGQVKTYNLSGTILDSTGNPIESVSVFLFKKSDLTYQKGTITDLSGKYNFEDIQKGDYIIEASFLGYRKENIDVSIINKDIQTATIVLEDNSQMLSTIIITPDKKRVQLDGDKTVFNISTSLSGAQGNAFDILKNVPGITVKEDGSVYLYGQAGVNILVDNKLTYMSGENLVSLLRSMSSASVDKIELMSQPSSRYDASGNGGLINIQTKKTRAKGINLALFSNYKQGRHSIFNESINLSIRKDKLHFYADYSYNYGHDYMDVLSDRMYPNVENKSHSDLILQMEANRKFQYDSHFIRTGISYDLSSRFIVDAYVSTNWFKREKNEVTNSSFLISDVPSDSSLITTNLLNVYHKNITGRVNLLYKFAEDAKWNLAFDSQRFNNSDNQNQDSHFEPIIQKSNNDLLSGNMSGNININVLQTNIEYPLSKKITMEAGTKFSFVSINNSAMYHNYLQENWVDNPSLSNNFSYKENINSGYVQMKMSLSRSLSLLLGLRAENTNIKGKQATLTMETDSIFKHNYTHIFPSIFAQYKLADDQTISLLYGRRITRPNYRDLNPFIEINDRYLYEQGNTNLKPELSDNIELSYRLRESYGINIKYTYRSNPITKSYLVENENRVLVTPMNLTSNYSLAFQINLNNIEPTRWWTVHINPMLVYNRFAWLFDNTKNSNNLLTPMIYLNNQFNLPKGWKTEVNGFYNGKIAEGQARIGRIWQVSVGIRKSILNNNGSIMLFVDDMFATNQAHINLIGSVQGWYKEKRDSRMVGITINYRFNSGSKTKDSQYSDRIDESKRINL